MPHSMRTEGVGGDIRQFHIELTEPMEPSDAAASVPVKIGDGNFGIVLAAQSAVDAHDYALKIIYDHVIPQRRQDRSPTYASDLERVDAELRIGVELPQKLRQFVKRNTSRLDETFQAVARRPGAHIVLPLAYSDRFGKFDGKEELARLDVKLSTRAYLMERYDCTLKDLVERASDQVTGADANQSDDTRPEHAEGSAPSTGYSRLQQVVVREKERSAVPILEQVARGLQTLHAAALRHQDIKPANIYYRRVDDDAAFRLGDLGFLRPTDDPAIAGSAVAREPVGLGTRHYRSIEQLDFCDTAQCDVHVGDCGQKAILKSRDPKFMDTNIRKGDLAYFAKSNTRRLFNIVDLTKDAVAGLVKVHIEISQATSVPEDGEEAEPNVLVKDTNTQVSFLKNPTAKTDLFGVGAILFDILSAGDSPERFYELLRRFDTGAVSIDSNIVRLYDTWRVGIVDDADIAAIFGRVSGSRGQAVHIEILRFLLKCMMSNCDDSFYAKHGFATAETEKTQDDALVVAVGAWSEVIKQIKSLERAVGAQGYEDVGKNILTRSDWAEFVWKPDTDPEDHYGSGIVEFTRVMGAYRQGTAPVPRDGSSAKPVIRKDLRWPLGASLLYEIVEELTRSRLDTKPGELDIVSLAPEHLGVNPGSIILQRHVVKGDEASLVDCMRRRDPLLSGIRPFTQRYEPIWWPYRTRRVLLTLDNTETSNSAVLIGARIEYSDFSVSGLKVHPGDFVLPSETTSPAIFRVAEVREDGCLALAVHDDRIPSDGRPEGLTYTLEDGFLVKNPDRVDYYAGMLAIYMFHILISDGTSLHSEVSNFPAAVYTKLADYPVQFGRKPGERPRYPPRTTVGSKFGRYTSELIMWLSLGGYHFGDDNDAEKPDEGTRWGRIDAAVEKWRDAVVTESGVKVADYVHGPDIANVATSHDKRLFGALDHRQWESICHSFLKTATG